MDRRKAIFFLLQSIILSRSLPINLAMMCTVVRAKREENVCDMFNMLIYIVYTYTYTLLVRAKRGEKLYCTICSMLIYIIYTYKYTHLVRAKRGEKIKLYYVYYTTLYCAHIALHLFSSARSAEIKRIVLDTACSILYKYNLYYIYI